MGIAINVRFWIGYKVGEQSFFPSPASVIEIFTYKPKISFHFYKMVKFLLGTRSPSTSPNRAEWVTPLRLRMFLPRPIIWRSSIPPNTLPYRPTCEEKPLVMFLAPTRAGDLSGSWFRSANGSSIGQVGLNIMEFCQKSWCKPFSQLANGIPP